MELGLKVKPKKYNRQEILKGWLAMNNLDYKTVAKAIGVTSAFVSQALNEKKPMPEKRWRQMVEIGIPSDLLPEPFDRARARGGSRDDSGV